MTLNLFKVNPTSKSDLRVYGDLEIRSAVDVQQLMGGLLETESDERCIFVLIYRAYRPRSCAQMQTLLGAGSGRALC